MEFNAAFVFFKSFSAKHGKKGKEKRNDYSVIEQNALKRQLYGKYFNLKGSHPKMTGQNDRQNESLTGQVHDRICGYKNLRIRVDGALEILS